MPFQTHTRALSLLFSTSDTVSPEHALDQVRAFVSMWAGRLPVAQRRHRASLARAQREAASGRGGAGAGAGGRGGGGGPTVAGSGLVAMLAARRRRIGSPGSDDDSD